MGIPIEVTLLLLTDQNIWQDILGLLYSRDVELMVISLTAGWGITHYYYRRQIKDLRKENRELTSGLEDLQYQLKGQRTLRVRELIARYRLIPRNLSEQLAGDTGRLIGLYNEDVMYAQEALRKKLREAIGQDYWADFSSAFDLVLHLLMGERTTVGEYLVSLEDYVLHSIPVGMWYDAFCTALYHSTKFPQIGVPPRFKGGLVITIKQANKEDLFLAMDDEVEDFAKNVYEQLRQITLEESKGVNIIVKELERVL